MKIICHKHKANKQVNVRIVHGVYMLILLMLCAVLCARTLHLPIADWHQLAVSGSEQAQEVAVASYTVHAWACGLPSQAFVRRYGILL